MHQSETQAISNAIVRKILLPDAQDHQNRKLSNLMDENHIKKVFTMS